MKAAAAMLTVFTCIGHTRLARAAPFELEWSAPEDCPSRERIVAALNETLGEPERNAPPELLVRGTVRMEGGTIVVHLEVRDVAGKDLGERRLRHAERDCLAIEEPTAIVLAMMISVARPRLATGGPTVEPSVEPAPNAAPEPTPGPVSPAESKPRAEIDLPPRAAPERKRALGPTTVSAAAVTSVGLLPRVGFGGALRWTATLPPLLVIGAEGTFATTWATRAAGGDVSFRSFDIGALLGVRLLREHRFETVPLLAVRGGLMTASVTGLASGADAIRLVGFASAGVLGRLRLGPALYLEALPEVRVPFGRDDFQVLDGMKLIRVHRPAAVEARLSLGIGWEFR